MRLSRQWVLKTLGLIALLSLAGPCPTLLGIMADPPQIPGRYEPDFFIFIIIYLAALLAWVAITLWLWANYRRRTFEQFLVRTRAMRENSVAIGMTLVAIWVGLVLFHQIIKGTAAHSHALVSGTTMAAIALSGMVLALPDDPAWLLGRRFAVFANSVPDAMWIIGAVTFFVVVAFAIDASPLLRGPGEWPPEWRWQYKAHELIAWRLVIPPLILAAIAGLVRLWKTARVPIYVVLVIAVLGLAMQVAVDALRADEQFAPLRRTTYLEHFGYFPPANNVKDMRAFLDDFAQNQPNFEGLLYYRVRSHPPGYVAFYWSVIEVHEKVPLLADVVGRFMATFDLDTAGRMGLNPARKAAATSSGVLVAALASFAVVPLYALGRAERDKEGIGRRALILWPVVASVVVYVAVANQMMTLLTATVLWLTYLALRDDSPLLMFLAGVVWSVATFMTVATLVILAIMGMAILVECVPGLRKRDRASLRRLILMGLALSLGAVSFWIVMQVAFDLEGLQIVQNVLGSHNVTRVQRTYWKWVLYSPYEFLVYAGVPLTMLFLYEVYNIGKAALARQPLSLGDRLLLVSVGMLLLLVISGSSRAEVARQWLLFVPIPFWGAIRGAERLGLSDGHMVALAAMQLAQIIVFRAFLVMFV